MDFLKIEKQLIQFLTQSLKSSGRKNFVIGISGGLDSAVVSALCIKISPKNTFGLLLPSQTSNQVNIDDALSHCASFGIPYEIIKIAPILISYKKTLGDLNATREGNLAARIRMSVLYDYSAKFDGVVVGTSNLSERMIGYGTIFGDLACAFNPIGEMLKTEIFSFAEFLGIDKNIISKAPSADLWEGQSDEDELGYSYAKLDVVLDEIYKQDYDKNRLYDKFGKEIVDFIIGKMKSSSFKLEMPKIAKIR